MCPLSAPSLGCYWRCSLLFRVCFSFFLSFTRVATHAQCVATRYYSITFYISHTDDQICVLLYFNASSTYIIMLLHRKPYIRRITGVNWLASLFQNNLHGINHVTAYFEHKGRSFRTGLPRG